MTYRLIRLGLLAAIGILALILIVNYQYWPEVFVQPVYDWFAGLELEYRILFIIGLLALYVVGQANRFMHYMGLDK